MPFPILGSNSAVAGYEIDNSLRFNDGDSAYLNRTFATPTNGKKFTFSAWYKRSTLSTTQYIISYDSGGTPMAIIGFSSTDEQLSHLVTCCKGNERPECPIIDELSAQT